MQDSVKDADNETKIKEATENAEQRTENKEGAEDTHTGRNPADKGSMESVGFRSGISKGNTENTREFQENRPSERQYPNEDEVGFLFDRSNYISPPKNTPLYGAQKTLIEEYGIECYVLKASAWKRKNPACAYEEKIYVSEDINEYTLKTLVSHESTHVMRHKKHPHTKIL